MLDGVSKDYYGLERTKLCHNVRVTVRVCVSIDWLWKELSHYSEPPTRDRANSLEKFDSKHYERFCLRYPLK